VPPSVMVFPPRGRQLTGRCDLNQTAGCALHSASDQPQGAVMTRLCICGIIHLFPGYETIFR